MNGFLAKNPKQLDLCLRLLYAERIDFIVKVEETAKRKIVYKVFAKADTEKQLELKEKYRILTS